MTDTLDTNLDSRESRYREMMLEHVFLAELLQKAWHEARCGRGELVNVLRPDVDNAGYDLVLERGEVTRYVQLTSVKKGEKRVNEKLANRPGGCVIWLFCEETDECLKLMYRFFGAAPKELPDLGEELGTDPVRGTKKKTTRKLKQGQFGKRTDIHQIFDKLFAEQTG